MLTLPIKKKWFDMVLSGEKKEEYRELSAYWDRRIMNETRKQGITSQGHEGLQLILSNGYGKKAPKALVTLYSIHIGYGKPEWGADPERLYFILHIREATPWEK